MIVKKWSMFLAGIVLLTACSNEEAAPAEPKEKEPAAEEQQQEMTESGFITQVRGEEILVNNIYFKIGEDVKVNFDDGGETAEGAVSDIRTGMKVSVDYTGPLAESFPMQGEANVISILNDEDSASQSEALQEFINKEQVASLIIMGQPIVRDNEIGFLFSNMEDGNMSEVRIDLDTHEYTIGGE